jgi:hypothetical protein
MLEQGLKRRSSEAFKDNRAHEAGSFEPASPSRSVKLSQLRTR